MTMNRHWGWNKHDQAWKSDADLIRKLADIASKGGNFLLNIGPKADGTFPEEAIARLESIGRWMDVNAESIHGTSASPLGLFEWGRCTRKERDDGTTLYLHVFKWPEDGQLKVPGLLNKVSGAHLLATGAVLESASDEQGLTVTVPGEVPDTVNTVIVLEVPGELKVKKS
jgi:alpha-L-fucosidase